VLVPGGWQGGWAFDAVAARLREAGHRVEPVTLSGLEPDGPVDPTRPANLAVHIDQVAAIVGRDEDQPVALCAHSYGGMVLAGVADRLPGRIDTLVFIDAYVPDDGDSCWSLTSDEFRDIFIDGSRIDGRWVAVPDGLDSRARPHPLPSFLQAVTLTGTRRHGQRRVYISGGAWPGSPFVTLSERLRDDEGWQVFDIPVGHNIAGRDPDALAAVLDAVVSGR
jgi:pimeloyl-ACP methyl ester carboxylesterase